MLGGIFDEVGVALSVRTGFDVKEVSDEEVAAAAFAVWGFCSAVACAGDEEEVEVFVGFDECVDDLKGGGGVDVAVEFTDDEEEFASEFVCLGDV